MKSIALWLAVLGTTIVPTATVRRACHFACDAAVVAAVVTCGGSPQCSSEGTGTEAAQLLDLFKGINDLVSFPNGELLACT